MEGEYCCSSSSSSSTTTTTSIEKRKQRQNQQQKQQVGGNHDHPCDTTVFYLRCPYTHLNFPKLVFQEDGQQLHNMSAASIRKKATEVRAKVDAVEIAHRSPISQSKTTSRLVNSQKPNLNKYPDPENSDEN
ncbi:PREDICTED: ethylene-responsive mRNAion [Prunus dulcis]|uniref:PREDICTED: ethylene-responsive mRNAion n=1 Tax=Prunus dulcis TaxID=3755 RepID=A0A5E4FMF5_PRUDU|nr:PREDICTED: ethylene-responsive mRNAion [Prunus dulcis]